MTTAWQDMKTRRANEQKQYAAAKDPRAAAPRTRPFTGTYSEPADINHRSNSKDFLLIPSKDAAAPQIERVPFFA